MFPASGRIEAAKGTREIVVTGLPYIVVYRIGESSVYIIGVFHCSEDAERGG
jgi:toxin ParE1/3/4